MFNLSFWSESELQGTIKVDKPVVSLGRVTDVNGTRWDVGGIFTNRGEQTVVAVPECELHPYFSSTSTGFFGGLISQTWKPYKIELINKKEKEYEVA